MSETETERILNKLDEYLRRCDLAAAERHLKYWLDEAAACGDRAGELMLLNEQIGLYRRRNKENEALAASEAARSLAEELLPPDDITLATTLINVATAYKAFGRAADALPLYSRAEEIYRASLYPYDPRFGALYNNMALACADTGDFTRAQELFGNALEIMSTNDAPAEMAITYCNLADLAARADADPTMCLTLAIPLLDTAERDENYAYACEKCASAFAAYGFEEYAAELAARAKESHEGT